MHERQRRQNGRELEGGESCGLLEPSSAAKKRIG